MSNSPLTKPSLESEYLTLHDYFNDVLAHRSQIVTRRAPTLLELAGFPDYENVVSNVYAHFLNDRQDGLGHLFMTALLACANVPGTFLMDAWVAEREISVAAGRIDLLIREDSRTPEKVIVLENKIYHHTDYNDFAGYLCAYTDIGIPAFGILLTLNPVLIVPPGFTNITHQQWISHVKDNLGGRLTDIPLQKLIILQDFIHHIDRYYESKVSMDSYRFLFENAGKIYSLIELRDMAVEQLRENIRRAVQGRWQSYRSSASSVAFQRNSLVIYVTTDKLLNSDQSQFQVQLWLKGKTAVSVWNSLSLRPSPGNEIEPGHQKTTTMWSEIASKTYDVKFAEIECLGETVKGYINKEWEPFAKEVEESLRVPL